MAGTHYWIDKTEKTANVYQKVIKKYFPSLKALNFLFTMRDKEKTDDEGNIIAAECRKASVKETDLWSYHFEICMDDEIWSNANISKKYRIAYHELLHCGVELEEGTSEVIRDDNGNPKLYLNKHDLFLKTFKQEIETFGFEGTDFDVATFLSDMLEDKNTIKKNKKKFLADVGIGAIEEEEPVKKKKKRESEEITLSTTKSKKKIVQDDEDEDDEPIVKKKKKKLTSEELEAEADKILGIKKKKKDKFIEVDMKEHNRNKFGKRKK